MDDEKKEKLRARKIDRAMMLTISSLKSHLYYTHDGELARGEDYEFHKRCVKEYCELIKLLGDLY